MAAPFGRLLRHYRKAAGLTQHRLAALAGVSPQAVSTLERGTRHRPRRHTVEQLIKGLGVGASEAAALRSSAADTLGVVLRPPAEEDPPRWLPPAVSDFVGRDEDLDRIVGLFTATPSSPAPVVATIEGMGGVGKTTLAVTAAHLASGAFPDGQIYVDLRGFGPGERLAPLEAIDHVLTALGRQPGDHTGIEHATGRYRTALAGRRVLIVLDNASGPDQVESLLPATAGSAAIVTSRQSLAAVPAAHHTFLHALSEDDGVDLLASIVGVDRSSDRVAMTDVVRWCGGLPLAIRIAGARLSAHQRRPIGALANQLADHRQRLDQLEVRDAGVRASFGASLLGLQDSTDALDKEAAQAFPLLGVIDEPQVSLPVAARLIDHPESRAERILERLVDSHLVESTEFGQYRLHDLLRTYANDIAGTRLAPAVHAAALKRVLVLYNTVAWRELERSSPTHLRLHYRDPVWTGDDDARTNSALDLSWLTEERTRLVGVLRSAARRSDVPVALITQTARASLNHLNIKGHWFQLIATSRVALEVAEDSGDTIAEGFAHHDLGAAYTQLDRAEDAVAEFEAAARCFRSKADEAAEAMVLCNLAHTFERIGRIDEGIEVGLRALDLCAARDLRHLEATTCLAVGLLYGHVGDHARELEYHERSVAMYAELHHDRGVAYAMHSLGMVRRAAGRVDEAITTLEAAIELTDEQGLISTAAESRTELANLYVAIDRPDLALTPATEALDIAVRVDSEIIEARSRHCIGDIMAATGHDTEAHRQWSAAQALYERLESSSARVLKDRLASAGQPGIRR